MFTVGDISREVPFLFFTAKNPNLDFDPPADADFAADRDAWRAECAVSREVVATHDLDDTERPFLSLESWASRSVERQHG